MDKICLELATFEEFATAVLKTVAIHAKRCLSIGEHFFGIHSWNQWCAKRPQKSHFNRCLGSIVRKNQKNNKTNESTLHVIHTQRHLESQWKKTNKKVCTAQLNKQKSILYILVMNSKIFIAVKSKYCQILILLLYCICISALANWSACSILSCIAYIVNTLALKRTPLFLTALSLTTTFICNLHNVIQTVRVC